MFHADESRYVSAFRASRLGLVSFMRLDGRKDIQSVKSAWPNLHSEDQACVVPPPKASNKRRKTDT